MISNHYAFLEIGNLKGVAFVKRTYGKLTIEAVMFATEVGNTILMLKCGHICTLNGDMCCRCRKNSVHQNCRLCQNDKNIR